MKKKETGNYLEKVPCRRQDIVWNEDENAIITLEIENKGFVNSICQKLFKKPRISYIHLDETGSFIWPLLDGERSIMDLGVLVEEHFGEKAHPLYERLAKYFMILDSYGFVKWANK